MTQLSDAELKRRYEAGESTLTLMATTGESYRRTRKRLDGAGVIFRPSAQRKDSTGLARAHAAGLSQREIAYALGVAPSTVNRWLREAGLPGRPVGRPRRNHPSNSDRLPSD